MKPDNFTEEDPLQEDHRARSNFVRKLVQSSSEPDEIPTLYLAQPPKRIVQFWNDIGRLPRDVRDCIDSWKKLEQLGFQVLLFDERSAREFIRKRLGSRYENSFDKCYHPA